MKNFLKYCLFVVIVLVSALTISSCDDWTDPESLDLRNPSFEEQNPQLYADYLQALRAYKEGDHKVLFVSFDNPTESPTKQAERVTTLPDSVDFICLNKPNNLHPVIQEEMGKVRSDKGTKTVYNINYDAFETEWREMLKNKPELTEEEALQYLGESTDAMLSLCDRYNFDGIVIDYIGRSLVGLTKPELAKYNTRQQNFFDRVMAWREGHDKKALVFYGNVQYLFPETMNMLSKYDYILLKTALSTSEGDLSLKSYLAIRAGEDAVAGQGGAANPVPSNRFMACVQLPRADDKDEIIGYWDTFTGSSKKLAALGAAQWSVQESLDYTRKGLFIMNVHNDYYNNHYAHVRNVIRIMNPNK